MVQKPIRTFDIALVQARASYHQNEKTGPRRNFLVLSEELEHHGGLASYIQKIETGMIRAEPLIIRANTGEFVDIRLLNFTGEPINTPITKRLHTGTKSHSIPLHDQSPEWRGAKGVLLIEEAGTTFHDSQTGEELLFGTNAVIRRSDGTSFREFVLLIQDTCLNGRSEPMSTRWKENKDPAYLFSSILHGDPDTPLFETYPGDELLIRLLDDNAREKHAFHVAGMPMEQKCSRTAFHVTQPYAPGDYLYYFDGAHSISLGLWGIIRAHHHPIRKLPLLSEEKHPVFPLVPQPDATAIIHSYELAAIHRPKRGRRNEDELLIVPLSEAEQVRHRTYRPSPLALEAGAGEWIRVTLHNLLSPSSIRVFLSPQSFSFDPVFHSGINVGLNPWEQTVKPGQCRSYLWHADQECRICPTLSLKNMPDSIPMEELQTPANG